MHAGPLVVVSRLAGVPRRTLQLDLAGTVALAPADVELPGGVRLTATGAAPGAPLALSIGDASKVRRCLVDALSPRGLEARVSSAAERATAFEGFPAERRTRLKVGEPFELLTPAGLLEVFTFRAVESDGRSPLGSEVLEALVALHAEDSPASRRVLHDRLEECGASAEAAYARLQQSLGGLDAADDALVKRVVSAVREAGRLVGPTFRYLMARDIDGCAGLRWALRCPKDWDDLRDVGISDRRFCDTCRQEVHLATNEDAARLLAQEGRCVALFLDDLEVMGDLAVPDPDEDF